MSLYDKASLVQIPSGYKAGTLYSVLPANGDGDFTHVRATSATRVNKDGLIESVASGVPRLDYPLLDGVVQSCPALLLEPSRTNEITQSEDFNSYTKVTSDATAVPVVTNDYAISPDGSQNASRVVVTKPTGDTQYAVIKTSKTITKTAGDKFAQSVYLKATDSSQVGKYVDIYSYDGSYLTVENYQLTSDWVRVEIIHTASTGTSTTEMLTLGKARSTVGGSTLSNMATDFLVFGGQFEAGSYPTSYIPTTGSTVTRNADECNGAGTSAEFNDSEGVLFAEIAGLDEAQGTSVITISDSSLSDRILIAFVSGELRGEFVSTGGTITRNSSGLVIENFNKIACSYTATTFKVFVNGLQVGTTGTVTTSMSGIVELAFDRGDGANNFYGNTKQLMTFNEALTDSELEQITSWRSFDEMAKGQLYTIE